MVSDNDSSVAAAIPLVTLIAREAVAKKMRAGWMMKEDHTIFDYLDQSPKNDRQVARVITHWTTGSGPEANSLNLV
jgi:hypothetical protein